MRLPLFLFLMTSITACNAFPRESYLMTMDLSLNQCQTPFGNTYNDKVHQSSNGYRHIDYECECMKGFSIAGYLEEQVICLQD
jgi:hypothetical protein